MARIRTEWIVKAMVESFFVVASILMALALDEWAENRRFTEIADQALGIFEQEMLRNQAGLDEVAPFHEGIRDVLGQMMASPDPGVDLRSIMEGIETPVLLDTAWETALATGALTHMSVEVVSALSLTYSLQDRFAASGGANRPRLAGSGSDSPEMVRERIREAYEYMVALTRGEAELRTVFGQALALIRVHRTPADSTAAATTDQRETAHP